MIISLRKRFNQISLNSELDTSESQETGNEMLPETKELKMQSIFSLSGNESPVFLVLLLDLEPLSFLCLTGTTNIIYKKYIF